MDLQGLYDSIGAAGVALVGVAAAAIYLCVKNAVALGWMGWGFHRHIAALTRDPARLDTETGARSGNPLIRIFSEAVRAGEAGTTTPCARSWPSCSTSTFGRSTGR